MTNIVLTGSDDFVFRVIEEFIPVGKPADSSWDHEQDWEHVSGETKSLVNNTAVEIDVRI